MFIFLGLVSTTKKRRPDEDCSLPADVCLLSELTGVEVFGKGGACLLDDQMDEIMPCRMAYCTSSALLVIPNSSMTRYLWKQTVRWETFKMSAISFIGLPSAKQLQNFTLTIRQLPRARGTFGITNILFIHGSANSRSDVRNSFDCVFDRLGKF